MKKYVLILLTCGTLALTLTACHDEEHIDTDKADSLSTMPMETPPAARQDTTAVPPVEPGMDTAATQAPKM